MVRKTWDVGMTDNWDLKALLNQNLLSYTLGYILFSWSSQEPDPFLRGQHAGKSSLIIKLDFNSYLLT